MFANSLFFTFALLCPFYLLAAAASVSLGGGGSNDELYSCAEQLTKYRKFILQAIVSFEDVCDAYNSHATSEFAAFPADAAATAYYARQRNYDSAAAAEAQRSQSWAFFKLLMAQFNDMEFLNVIRDAVIERCHVKAQQQRDEKRNSVVLGKKQRFHSWGGKRSQSASLLEEHNAESGGAFVL